MKKQERKENGNKGFSLVELIVVVAIMAVLLVVLTPQYLRYVERTRLQRDNTAIAEIANAVKLSLADENINSATTYPVTITLSSNADGNKEVTFSTGVVSGANVQTALATEVAATIATTYATSSNTYKESTTDIVLTVSTNATTGTVTVSAAGWIESVGGTPTSADPDDATNPAKVF